MTEQRALCGAKKRQGEGFCARPAGAGTPHPGVGRCKHHGGCTPDHVTAAVQQSARVQLAELGYGRPVANPLEELLRVAGEARALVEIARDRAAGLLDGDAEDATYQDAKGTEEVRAMLSFYERALDRAAAVMAKAAALKIDERLTTIVERDLARIEAVLEQVWQAGRAGVPLEDAREDAGRRLRAVS